MAERGQGQGRGSDEVEGLTQEQDELDEDFSPLSEELRRVVVLETAQKEMENLISALTDVITQQQGAIMTLQEKAREMGVVPTGDRLAVIEKEVQGLRAKVRVHETHVHGIEQQ